MTSLIELQQKYAKDERAVLVQFKNDSTDTTFTLDFHDVDNGKVDKKTPGNKKDVKVKSVPPHLLVVVTTFLSLTTFNIKFLCITDVAISQVKRW